MSTGPSRWTIDPDDPRAPPTEIWKSMSPEERAEVVATLPSEFSADELIDRIRRLSAEAQERVQQLEAELAEEQRRRENEQRRREAAEAALQELRTELERLRARKD